jgi:hypothetical protein
MHDTRPVRAAHATVELMRRGKGTYCGVDGAAGGDDQGLLRPIDVEEHGDRVLSCGREEQGQYSGSH